jgi:NAD(P)-dependent dehydrogenase (short-subunit alcohol dehydrogenase family)
MTEHRSLTVLVTGATDGLGRGVAIEIAKRGATVLVHGRDEQRIAATLTEIERAAPNSRARSYRADLSSLAQTRALAQQLLAAEPRLDVLINNAGIGATVPGGPSRQESKDGHELRFAVNYLAPFLLTRLLLPVLRRSTPARIVNVSSIGQQDLDFSDVMLQRDYSGSRAYRQSKLAQILDTFELAPELAGSGVTITALHPATFMPTKMVVAAPLSTLEQGVTATVRLAIDADVAELSGVFFDGLRQAEPLAQARDAGARRQLRALSEQLTARYLEPLTPGA